MEDFDLRQKYEKLFSSFNEIDSIPVEEWKSNHVLGYFIKKYKKQYNIDYSFKFDKPQPSKCFEVFTIKRLGENLTTKPTVLKDYIDFVFDNFVKKAKRRITSVSFLLTEKFLIEYKKVYFNNQGKQENINRYTELPSKFAMPEINVNTWGDLAFIARSGSHIDKIKHLISIGLDISILERVI